ncbi:hypothetical protein F5Y10DRAFT_243265 [Nemania abortiva]|nr:hypothetical protein F5Y10DRAFT_243265 [Nemania abortiva]
MSPHPRLTMAPVRKLGLKVIYDPVKDTKNYSSDVDLVLVHGFGGDPFETWTYQEDGTSVFWPEDLLIEETPQTRILSFGYEVGERIVGTIRDYARTLIVYLNSQRGDDAKTRPIVFLGHCLGGLIIKQALRFAAKETRYNSIAVATKSIMFFGTPHNGGDKKGWLEIAKKYKALGSKCKMIDILSKNTDDLIEIDEDFRQLTSKYTIVNFTEMRKMKGAKDVVVDKTSANFTCSLGFQSVPVDANHIGICKFIDNEDETFKEVCGVIKQAVGEKAVGKDATVKEAIINAFGREAIVRETIITEADTKQATFKETVIKETVVREVSTREAATKAKEQGVPVVVVAEEVTPLGRLPAPEPTPRRRILAAEPSSSGLLNFLSRKSRRQRDPRTLHQSA